MALQDLTPQLRTRLSRIELTVGWFITLATVIFVGAFLYYLYHTAERKGWFLRKVTYLTCVQNAAGLKAGDPVKLMGFEAGQITRIEANQPDAYYNVTVYFQIKEPYYGYLWSDSKVKVTASDFLGHRSLEAVKGRDGFPTVDESVRTNSGMFHRTKKLIQGVLIHEYLLQLKKQNQDPKPLFAKHKALFYQEPGVAAGCWLDPDESPALTDELGAVVASVKASLPSFLALTNQITTVLSNSTTLTANLNSTTLKLQPALSNLTLITAQLTNRYGSLGDWLIPTNLNAQAAATLTNASETLASTREQLNDLVTNVIPILENLAEVTSNLSAQVKANTNILSSISGTVIHTDDLVQGLKRHWFLRSAFRSKTNSIPAKPVPRKPRS